MAKVIAKVLGSSPTDAEASTVGELKTALNLSGHSAAVNGSPADDDQELSEGELVTFAPSVKGGNI